MSPTSPAAPSFGSTPSNTTAPLFEMRGVTKAFGDNVLFENAALAVHPGETLSIIGESGTGKSVWLKMMIGLTLPDAGQIRFKGGEVTELDEDGLGRVRRQVGYLFQGGALFDSMTVLDNVGYALREHSRRGDEEIRERVSHCLEMVGLSRRILELYPASLSGGMRKRVALARAIAIEPEIVLYDEPTQGLDPQSITRIAEMISSLQRDLKITSVLVTHDMRCAFSVSDRIAMLHERRFPYVGTPQELATSTEPPVHEFIKEALEEIEGYGDG